MRLTKLTSEDQNNKYVVDENQMEVGNAALGVPQHITHVKSDLWNAVGGVPYTMSLNVPH